MNYIFDKFWFKKHQNKLLWLLNTPIIKIWFRYVLRIRKHDCPLNIKITTIASNSFSWGDRYFRKKGKWYLERTTDFRTHNKYSKRLFYVFYPLWYLFHCWDILIANRFAPQFNLGYDTLTVYPDAGQAEPDNSIYYTSDTSSSSWATARNAGSGTLRTRSLTSMYSQATLGGTTIYIERTFLIFDTSALPDDATINSAILGIWVKLVTKGASDSPNYKLYDTQTGIGTSLVADDYDLRGSTSTSDTSITNPSTSTYNNYTLNAYGLTTIYKTGQSKFSIVESVYDQGNVQPVGINYIEIANSNTTGTDNDPKLVVTYTIPVVKDKMFLMF